MILTPISLEDLLGHANRTWLGLISILFATDSLALCLTSIPNERIINECIVGSLDGALLSEAEYQAIEMRLQRSGNMLDGVGTDDYPSSFNYSILPTVSWDPNVNGGNPSKPLTVGAITFVGDPSLYAKSGWLAGVSTSIVGRAVVGQQKYIEFSAYNSLSKSPNYGVTVYSQNYTLCGRFQVVGSVFIDHCNGYISSSKAHGDVDSYSSSQKLLRTFPLLGGHAEAAFMTTSTKSKGVTVDQNLLSFSFSNSAGMYYNVTAFKKLSQQQEKTPSSTGQSAAIYSRIWDRNVHLKVGTEAFESQQFLGSTLTNKTLFTELGVEVLSGASAKLILTDQLSSINYFSSSSAALSFQMLM